MGDRDDQALSVGRAVLALFEALGVGLSTALAVYDQGHLPPGVGSRGAYLERHRQRVRAGVPGWSRAGQGRVVTAAAWATDVERETARSRRRPVTPPPAANDTATAVERALGIRVHRGGR